VIGGVVPHKVLLIDDSRTMREVLKVYLMGGRYEFVEANTGSYALDVLRRERVDLVIADVNMPQMDGFQFVRAVRASNTSTVRSVPIILVTSDKSEHVRQQARDVHVDAFMQKPVSATKLLECVEKLLDGAR
jgi:two-component system chemotaxis response regulator CheY